MESSYMEALDGSDPLGKAVMWSRTDEEVQRMEEQFLQQQEVPVTPLPTTSYTSLACDVQNRATSDFHILYTGHGSPLAKHKVRQSLAQAMAKYFTTVQQQQQRLLRRQQQQQVTSLPRQQYNVVISEALHVDTYQDNGMILWETDATWTLPSLSLLFPLTSSNSGNNGNGSNGDNDDGDDSSGFIPFLPQSLYTDLLPQLMNKTSKKPPIDLVIYFCNQLHGPLEQDFMALRQMQLPVLPLLIDPPQPAFSSGAPCSDPDYPPSLSSSCSSSSSQLVNIPPNTALSPSSSPSSSSTSSPSSPTVTEATAPTRTSTARTRRARQRAASPTTMARPDTSSTPTSLLRDAISSYLSKYHIHCFNVTEIHPELPGFMSNSSTECPGGIPSPLCHVMSAKEIMHVDQFTSLDTENMYRLMANIRKYNDQLYTFQQRQKQQSRKRQYTKGWAIVVGIIIIVTMVSFALTTGMVWKTSNSFFSKYALSQYGEDMDASEKVDSLFAKWKISSGFEYPDANMYHRFTLTIANNGTDDEDGEGEDAPSAASATNAAEDTEGAEGAEGANDEGASGEKEGDATTTKIHQARLVWEKGKEEGGMWTLTKTDWTAHVPSPCKMDWDTDMKLALWIDMNGHWEKVQLFTLAWIPCQTQQNHHYQAHQQDDKQQKQQQQQQQQFDDNHLQEYDRNSSKAKSSSSSNRSSSNKNDNKNNKGIEALVRHVPDFSLAPYHQDILYEWWIQITGWAKQTTGRFKNILLKGSKKMKNITMTLYTSMTQ